MKFIIPLILIALLHVSGVAYGQKVTIVKKKAKLVEIFKSISEQTGQEFIASPGILSNAQVVDINVSNQELKQFLPALLEKQGLAYAIVNNVIVITRSPKKQSQHVDQVVPDTDSLRLIRGYVRDQTGTPLPGATVMIKGTRKGTATDVNGYFKLHANKSMTNGELVITYTGFGVMTATADFSQVLNFTLSPSANELDQIQVIAYGTTTKRFSTGNISSVSGDEIIKNPVTNLLLGLPGRAPGLVIMQKTGFPGGAVDVQLRGINSIANGHNLLYIMDGVPVRGGTSGSISSPLLQGNRLELINPGDIESIDILKDADATSIYGSRGANGVLLITTKKGKQGPLRVNASGYEGFGKVTSMPEYMNLQEYLQLRREAFINDNAVPGRLDNDINGTWDTTRYTDWQKLIIGNTAHISDLQGNVSGGTDNVQYYVSGSYHRETAVTPTDGSLQRGSAHLSVNGASDNKKFTFSTTGIYTSITNTLTPDDAIDLIATLAPNAPAPFKPDGSLNWENNTFSNPFATLRHPFQGRSRQVLGAATLGYQVINGMEIKLAGGFQRLTQYEYAGYPLSLTNPADQPTSTPTAFYRNAWNDGWNIEPQLNYRFSLAKGSFETLLGATFKKQAAENMGMWGKGYASDGLLKDPMAAKVLTPSGYISGEDKYNATFGRIKYIWDNKYILTLNSRYDGSSRLSPGNRYHFFWSGGAAWIFTQEKAVSTLVPFLSFGKLRGSYGTTGNDDIGDYSYYDSYLPFDFQYQGQTGLRPTSLFNQKLSWETTRKIEVALDLGFLNDRILATASYYTNSSTNQILPDRLSAVTGFTSIRRNLPAVVINNGWEMELRTVNIKSKNFEWTSLLNFAIPRNKLTRYDGLAANDPNFIIGKPLYITRVYTSAGVDPQTGQYLFLDSEGKAVPNPDQQTGIVDPTIKYYGGFENTLRYKGWSLDFLFQFANMPTETAFQNSGIFPPGSAVNQIRRVALDRWQKPGDVKPIAKSSQSLLTLLSYVQYAQRSDLAYTRVSYLRLKNAYLSYQLPAALLKKLRVQQLSLFAQGQDLLTFAPGSFKDADPETGGINMSPISMLAFGLKLTL